jgi:hypothetical protein
MLSSSAPSTRARRALAEVALNPFAAIALAAQLAEANYANEFGQDEARIPLPRFGRIRVLGLRLATERVRLSKKKRTLHLRSAPEREGESEDEFRCEVAIIGTTRARTRSTTQSHVSFYYTASLQSLQFLRNLPTNERDASKRTHIFLSKRQFSIQFFFPFGGATQ